MIEENVEKFVLTDGKVTLWQIAEELQNSRGHLGKIVREHFANEKEL